MRAFTALAAATLLVGACSSGKRASAPTSSTGPHGRINISDGQAGAYVENFNPFQAGSQLAATQGMIYETLMFFNQNKPGDIQPELATSYTWNSNGTKLDVTLRSGVKWSDGQPFTADDVAYTFGVLQKNAATNAYGLPLASPAATVTDPTHVTLNFSEPSYTDLWYALGQTYMVPKHIWSTIADPSKNTNTAPVGTGPFVVASFSPQVYKLKANPAYWQPGAPKIGEIDFTSYSGNDSSTAALAAGQLDWAGLFVPDVQNVYVKKSPAHNLYDVAHLFQTDLNPNLTKWPTNDIAVRRAISDAIDRATITKQVYSGIAGPASPVHMVQPAFAKYLAAPYQNLSFPPMDTAKAQAGLSAAGYTKGADGIFASSKGRLSITCLVVQGWSDYISLLQIVKQNLAQVGIDLQIQQVSYNDFKSKEARGDFQLVIDNNGGGPSPYFTYSNLLSSKNTAAASPDHVATTNWSGYSDPKTDQLLADIAAQPDDTDSQAMADYAKLEGVFVNDLPYIEVVQAGNLSEFTNIDATGWPSESDKYAMSPVWSHPDLGIVAKTITPTK